MFPQKHVVAVNNNDDNNNNDNNNNDNNNNDNNNYYYYYYNDNTEFSGVQELALLVHCLLVELLFGILVFVEEGKPEDLEKNLQNKNELNPHVTPGSPALQHFDGR